MTKLLKPIERIAAMAGKLTCFDVADYFLAQIDEDVGDLISNLKLQKLVYYAQGFHLAIFGWPLFDESLEAWTHGPVVPALYQKYKDYKSNSIARPEGIDFTKFDRDSRDLLDEVYSAFGQYSAWKLRNMTHQESPWRDAYRPDAAVPNNTISHDSMIRFFKTQLD